MNSHDVLEAPVQRVIAIDGPAGAGKSTVARLVARRLGFQFLDTGALYRCVGLYLLREQRMSDLTGWGEAAAGLSIRFREEAGVPRVLMNEEDVTEAIRAPEVSEAASVCSADPSVRSALLEQQRRIGTSAPTVTEGRDTGTVVFPRACLKVFLSASPEERARRRLLELQQRGYSAVYADVLAEIQARDARDSGRAVAPLMRAPDAIEICTDGMTIEQVTAEVIRLWTIRNCA